MAQVTLTVNGTPYQLACEDGQEAQLEELARTVDAKVTELAGSLGQIGDAKLMLMASLLLLDEATDDSASAEILARSRDVASAADFIERIAEGLESP